MSPSKATHLQLTILQGPGPGLGIGSGIGSGLPVPVVEVSVVLMVGYADVVCVSIKNCGGLQTKERKENFSGLYTQSWLAHVNTFLLRTFLGGSTPTQVLTMLSLTGPGY